MATNLGRPTRPPGTLVSDSGNLLTPLNSGLSLRSSTGGVFPSRDCITLSRPMPHPSSSAQAQPAPQPNILASEGQTPSSFTSGIHLVAIEHSKLPPGPSKPRRPRASIKNNKSSYISRGVTLDGFSKRISPASDGLSSYLLVANFSRSLVLLDLDGKTEHRHEPLSKVFLTTAWPLCHALNHTTKSKTQLDLAVGTSSGDILWIELVSNRYHRLNKTGSITSAPVAAVAWVPGSANLIAAAHVDGFVVIYDVSATEEGSPPRVHTGPIKPRSCVMRVVVSSQPSQSKGIGSKPLCVHAAYKLSELNLTSLKFLSSSLLAVSCRDGYLRLLDLEQETIPDMLPSFFAGVLDIALSFDGRYYAIAAEDDEITIHDVPTHSIVTRLQGHQAWVSAIAFDPYFDDQSGGTYYRLGSVGEDCTLMLWEFSPSSLAAPRVSPQPGSEELHDHTSGNTRLHAHISRARIPVTFPVAQCTPALPEFSAAPMSSLVFTERNITAANHEGRLWTWSRASVNR